MRPVLLTVPAIAAAVLLAGAACSADKPVPATPTSAGVSQQSAPAGGSAGGSGTSTSGTGNSGAGGSGATGSGTSGSGAGASGSGGKGAGTGTKSGAAAAACRTGDVGAVVTFQPDRTNGLTHMGLVTLTNKTKNTCTVDGWAAISLVNAADEVVPVKASRVNQPGAPVRTTLKPGLTAWAGIKWTACDKGDESCGVGNTLRFNLQASTDGDVARLEGFPNPAASDITMKNLQIGSLQPSRQGVVAW
jgi:hypothetical protein